jgi:hypothetical protein
MQARVSRKVHDRNERLPQAIRDKAQVRLCARYRRLSAARKPKVIVTTAIARELVGFLWAIARQVQLRLAAWRALLDHIGAQGRRQGRGGESSWPVMSRHCRRSPPRPRQPQDETTVMRYPTRA